MKKKTIYVCVILDEMLMVVS